jgi:hypothetical protein
MNTLTLPALALGLATLVLTSAGCVADTEPPVEEARTGSATQAWWQWSYGPPGHGFPLWCDETGACFSPLEGDFPWL